MFKVSALSLHKLEVLTKLSMLSIRSRPIQHNWRSSKVNKKAAQLSLTSMPKIAPVRRAYNVVADNTGLSSFV